MANLAALGIMVPGCEVRALPRLIEKLPNPSDYLATQLPSDLADFSCRGGRTNQPCHFLWFVQLNIVSSILYKE